MKTALFACLAVVAASAKVTMEPGVWKGYAPGGWQLVGPADPVQRITLSLAVKQQNLDVLEATLLEVSNPKHAKYGQHLTLEEVHELVKPRSESVSTVMAWLLGAGVAAENIELSLSGDWFAVTVPVAVAETLVGQKYFVYNHTGLRQPIVRLNGEYSLPEEIAEHLDFIRPSVGFPVVQHATVRRNITAPNDLINAPGVLRQLYQVDAVSKATNNLQGFASFLEQYFSTDDLLEFQRLFVNYTAPQNVSKIIGPNDQTNTGTEAELDVQYLMAMGAGVSTWAFYTQGREPGNPDNEPFLAWITAVNQMKTVPYVISVSYGDDEKSVGYAYASRVNTEFQKAGVRGISILFASGDDGTGGNCTASKGRFDPNFPADSPWVTAVGGLVGGIPGKVPTEEIADSISGGGFSDYWPTPAYQQDAVNTFFSTSGSLLPPANVYNRTGRGYPDLAAQSEMFTVVQDFIPLPGVGGTSCAAPTVSGIISLLNDLRLQNGKPPLGFLNPWLYQIGPTVENAFNDVTFGSNMGCEVNGFSAIKGWDAVTGWGSPNYSVLQKVVLQLP